MPNVLFLVSIDTPLGTPDQTLFDILVTAGWTVTTQIFGAASNSDIVGMDCVLVSDQGAHSAITGFFYDQSVPIVCIERGLGASWNFGTASNRSGDNLTDTEIVDTSHYITDGLPLGDYTVAGSVVRMNYVTGVGSGAQILSRVVSTDSTNAGDPSLVVYEVGADMANGATALGRRVYGWFTTDGNFNVAGESLFLRSMDWAAGLDSIPGPGRNIEKNKNILIVLRYQE